MIGAEPETYRMETLCSWSRRTEDHVRDLLDRRELPAINTFDGHLLFPSFQFSEASDPLPGLSGVMVVFDPGEYDAD